MTIKALWNKCVSQCEEMSRKNTYTVLQINISKYFIGKINRMLSFLLVSFFVFFFSLSISLTLISRSRRLFSPPFVSPSHSLCFVSLCWVPWSIYIFGIKCHYFVRARGAYKSPACRNLCIVKLLLLWPDTGQHRSSAKILISRWKQRQKS